MIELKRLDSGETELLFTAPGFAPITCVAPHITDAAHQLAQSILENLVPYLGTGKEGVERALKEGFVIRVRETEDDTLKEYRLGDEKLLLDHLKHNTPPFLRFDICMDADTGSLAFGVEMSEYGDMQLWCIYTHTESDTAFFASNSDDDEDFVEKLTSSICACLLERIWNEKGNA